MNTTRTLVLAAPIAAVALAFGAGTAQAADHGPVDKTAEVRPTHPGDPNPDLPIAIPEDDPTGPLDGPKDLTDREPTGGGDDSDDSIARPKRIDAGFAPVQSGGGDLSLTWAIAGGVVTAAGAATALRMRRA